MKKVYSKPAMEIAHIGAIQTLLVGSAIPDPATEGFEIESGGIPYTGIGGN